MLNRYLQFLKLIEKDRENRGKSTLQITPELEAAYEELGAATLSHDAARVTAAEYRVGQIETVLAAQAGSGA